MTNAPPVSFGATMLLTDGRVLLHEEPNCSGSTCKGKDYTAWYTLTPDINGSYANGTFTQVASLPGGYTLSTSPQLYSKTERFHAGWRIPVPGR